MATLQQIEAALRAADAAGNTEDAKRLAAAYKAARDAQPAANNSDFANMVQGKKPPGNEWARAAGLTARDAVEGVAGTLGIVTDPAVALWNAATGRQDLDARSSAGAMLDKVGLPRPNTGVERVVSGINQAVAGAGPFMGTGAAFRQFPGVAGRVGAALAERPALQVVSSAAAGGASAAARENGASPATQSGLGLLAGLTPGAATYGVQSGLRGLLRGGEAGRQTVVDNLATFGRSGASPSVGQASESRVSRGIESMLASAPGGAGPMARAAEAQAAQLGQRANQIATRLSPRTSGEDAGRAVVQGIKGDGGFVDQFKSKQRELFDQLDNFIPADQRIDMSSTKAALGSLNASIKGAPNTSKLFQNSRIVGIGKALESDLSIRTDEQEALAKALDNIDALYASRNAATQTSGQLEALANQQAGRTHNFYPVQGMPRFPGVNSGFPERAAQAKTAAQEAQSIARSRAAEARGLEQTVADLQAAAQASGGKLPYEAIKKLRTLVGQEMADAGLVSDVPRSKWKALYGALSNDLEAAAKKAGPEAYAAFSRANNYTRVGMNRLEVLDSVVERNGGPEKVFAAAMSGSREGATTLRAVTQSLPPDGRKQLAAAVVKRMGRATAGKQDEMGEVFSTETFLTNWNGMAPEAKSALFGRLGPRFNADMDAIAKAAANVRAGSKVFANPSGSGGKVAQIGAASSFGVALVTGNYGAASAVAAGVGGANGMARLMTHPPFVAWLAKQTKLPPGVFIQQVQALKRSTDPQMAEAGKALEDAVNEQNGGGH